MLSFHSSCLRRSIFGKDGSDFLRALLAHMTEPGDLQREHLELVACELKALRLNKAASLVADAAAQCPSMTDLRFCCYASDPRYTTDARTNQMNIGSWLSAQQRRAKRIRRECQELLRRAGVDPVWLSLQNS